MEVNRGPTRGLLGVREPVEGRPRLLFRVAAGDALMEPLRWPCGVREPVEGRPRELAMALGMDVAMGLARRL